MNRKYLIFDEAKIFEKAFTNYLKDFVLSTKTPEVIDPSTPDDIRIKFKKLRLSPELSFYEIQLNELEI